jgi:hypothetical protein
MGKIDIIPAFVGIFIAIGFSEYNRYKLNRYYEEQNRKNKEEIEKLYKRYVR